MTLVWKLLRKHVSVPQLAGFFLANLAGMLIVLLSLQFYLDVRPIFTGQDGVIGDDYLIVSKRLGVLSSSASSVFSEQEVSDLASQPFAKSVGAFTASQYKVACSIGMEGMKSFGTEMYFEAVPDQFVDADLRQWTFDPADGCVPIILPRSYLAIYNFGFAQSRSLPKLTEGVVSMAELMVVMRGDGQEGHIRGKIVGFSSRLNTILVPQSFIEWSNSVFAPMSDTSPTRLIVQVSNPTDDAIAKYMQRKGYNIDDDKLEAGKTMYFLKVLAALVMAVGLLISALSFYILTLSIYLLVQKNTSKLENLLLIGYSPARVCLPYQLLTVGVNLAVLLLAIVVLFLVRNYYLQLIWSMFPAIPSGLLWPSLALGALLFLVVSVLNVLAVRHRVLNIWKYRS